MLDEAFRIAYKKWQKEWSFRCKKKIRHNYKSLSELDRLFRNGDVYFVALHSTPYYNQFCLVVFDEHYKYVCEVKDVTSFDYRMLRKVYPAVYSWNDEVNELYPLSKREKS